MDKAQWIESIIQAFINNLRENTLQNQPPEEAFGPPLVGYSSGDDPLYKAYKEHVGPFHWTPWEIFTETFPDIKTRSGDLTVISWILPQTDATKKDQRHEKLFPSERWVRAKTFGEMFNRKLRAHIVTALQEQGYPAVAPFLSPAWMQQTSDQYGIASNWSERHAAYASGLGTFGLCDGLITPIGKAVRIGSIVANIRLTPTPRPYRDHHAYCLFFAGGTCRKCIDRCPTGAITDAGHDKLKCQSYKNNTCIESIKTRFGLDDDSCGLCQTRVPCESGIP